MSSFARYNIIYKLRAWVLDCFRKTFESIGFLRCITLSGGYRANEGYAQT